MLDYRKSAFDTAEDVENLFKLLQTRLFLALDSRSEVLVVLGNEITVDQTHTVDGVVICIDEVGRCGVLDEVDHLGGQVVTGVLDLQSSLIPSGRDVTVGFGGKCFQTSADHIEVLGCSGDTAEEVGVVNQVLVFSLFFVELRIRQDTEVVLHVTQRLCSTEVGVAEEHHTTFDEDVLVGSVTVEVEIGTCLI